MTEIITVAVLCHDYLKLFSYHSSILLYHYLKHAIVTGPTRVTWYV